MTRAKTGFKARRRRKRLLALARGFRGARKSRYRIAVHVVRRALCYAYRDRRNKKREIRSLWIIRINAASRAAGLKYSQLINGLKKSNIAMDRSTLADLAMNHTEAFHALVAQAKTALSLAA